MREGFPPATLIASREQVLQAYARMAASLQPIFAGQDCVVLGILLGGLFPLTHLAELLEGNLLLDYCQVGRYRGTEQGGELELIRPPAADLRHKTVLLVDDIFDQGVTLDFMAGQCRDLGAREIISAVLVRKCHDRAQTTYRPDCIGLEVEDRYVFGCGMDFRQRWRHVPEIWALSGAAA